MGQLQSIKSLDDLALIARYRETGNGDFIGELFRRYTAIMFGVCMKYLKDEEESRDAVMHIFEKMMGDLKKYDVKHLSGWMHSVTKNHCLMVLRSQKSKLEKNEEIRNEYPLVVEMNHSPHLTGETDKETMLQNLEEGITHLNTEQRTCIELFYLKQKCYEEVAQLTGYTLNQVKSYIQNGKRNLKLFLTAKHAGKSA